jgi:hypothetical protein
VDVHRLDVETTSPDDVRSIQTGQDSIDPAWQLDRRGTITALNNPIVVEELVEQQAKPRAGAHIEDGNWTIGQRWKKHCAPSNLVRLCPPTVHQFGNFRASAPQHSLKLRHIRGHAVGTNEKLDSGEK